MMLEWSEGAEPLASIGKWHFAVYPRVPGVWAWSVVHASICSVHDGAVTPAAAKLAAEKWATTHVPECAEALLREAMEALRAAHREGWEDRWTDAEPYDEPELWRVSNAAAFYARLAALLEKP